MTTQEDTPQEHQSNAPSVTCATCLGATSLCQLPLTKRTAAHAVSLPLYLGRCGCLQQMRVFRLLKCSEQPAFLRILMRPQSEEPIAQVGAPLRLEHRHGRGFLARAAFDGWLSLWRLRCACACARKRDDTESAQPVTSPIGRQPKTKRGPKPKDPAGEPMKPRRIRMTDAQWSDALFITPDRVRDLVTVDAKKQRNAEDAPQMDALRDKLAAKRVKREKEPK